MAAAVEGRCDADCPRDGITGDAKEDGCVDDDDVLGTLRRTGGKGRNKLLPRSQSLDASLSGQQQQQQREGGVANCRRCPPVRSRTCTSLAEADGCRTGSRQAVTRSVSTDTGLTVSARLGLRSLLTVSPRPSPIQSLHALAHLQLLPL
jgi:hypothetical protein